MSDFFGLQKLGCFPFPSPWKINEYYKECVSKGFYILSVNKNANLGLSYIKCPKFFLAFPTIYIYMAIWNHSLQVDILYSGKDKKSCLAIFPYLFARVVSWILKYTFTSYIMFI